MSPSFNSFGSTPSVSQLVWDSDLVIPAGKVIESAGGEVGIVGDVSISGSLNTEGAFTANDTIQGDVQVSTPLLTAPDITLATHPLNVITKSVASKAINTGDNTIELVSSQDAKITGAITFESGTMGTDSFTVSFTATDALGTSKNIKTYNGSATGSGTWTANIDVVVPPGTTKINVTATAKYADGPTSVSMTMSAYYTSLVF